MIPGVTGSWMAVLTSLAAGLLACASSDAVPDDGYDLRRDAGADAAPPSGTPKLEANDVSVLWPAPARGALPAGYLKIFPGAGEKGPALPDAARAIYESGFHADLPPSLVEPRVVVLALRVDPCAPRARGSCVPELRLSAEAMDEDFDDAATHLIYELSNSDLAAVVKDLRKLKVLSPKPTSGPLRVHPGLAAARVDSAYGRAWNDFVIKWATASRLARVTLNSFGFDNWFFRGIDRSGSWNADVFRIPGLPPSVHAQTWAQQALHENLDDPNGEILPAPTVNFAPLLVRGADHRLPRMRSSLDLVGRFRHPSTLTPANSDCVSCHLAPQTALFYEARGAKLKAATAYTVPVGFDASVSVPRELRGNLSNTIMFGWHRKRPTAIPSISQRVVYETAEVLRGLGEL